MNAIIKESKDIKILSSQNYNFYFDKKSGFFARWGKTQDDDPDYSPIGPEIADIEISTVCSGVKGIGVCKFCYKSNTPTGKNMSLETFKKLFHKLPKTITQIAFGIGDIWGNPDMWDIFNYAKTNGVIPNVTINGEGITDEVANKLVSMCGAVAVSLYDKDKTYNTIKKLTDLGMKQVNIHYMISEQTYQGALDLMKDKLKDERLNKLNAIVFLSLKPKGRAIKNSFNFLSSDKFKNLVDFAFDNNIGIGFDSCSAQKFLKSVKDRKDYNKLEQMSEPCESSLFSSYFNVDGEFYPCSFAEGSKGWEKGIDIISNGHKFLEDLWYNDKVVDFRNKTINCRKCGINCPIYELE